MFFDGHDNSGFQGNPELIILNEMKVRCIGD